MGREAYIPVLKPGRSTKYRETWSDNSLKLPETIVYDGQQITPADVRLIEVQYSNTDFTPSEPWTIIWLHVELLNDAIKIADFTWTPPKRVPSGPNVRKDQDVLFAKALQERAQMLAAANPNTVG